MVIQFNCDEIDSLNPQAEAGHPTDAVNKFYPQSNNQKMNTEKNQDWI